jgi:FMN phosphatase YigB (HAD superfamily)
MSDQIIASYDIWDTVIRRRCHPDTVKVHVARVLMLLAGDCIKPHLRDPWVLFHFRQLAERSIGREAQNRGLDDEYSIEHVLQRWIDTVTDRSANLPNSIVESLLREEIDQEKAVIYKDPNIEEQFRLDGSERRVFVSDFYMGKPHLVELLESVGLAHCFDEGYVSCDVGLNKRSGRLFGHVLETEGVATGQVNHWGDNHHSDVNMPRSIGIKSHHYVPEAEHAARVSREQRFHDREAVLRGLMRSEGSKGDDVQAIASRCAPLFIGFLLFVQEQIVRQGLERVYFFTREGEFFLRIYETLRAQSPFVGRLPKGELLEVSRIATFGPSVQELTATEMMRVWNLYSTQSPRAMLKTLDLPIDTFGHFFIDRGMELDTPIQYPWQDGRMIALFENKEFRSQAEDVLKSRREMFLTYCAQRGLDSSVRRCAVVDIGWRGTIQDNVACMMPRTHFSGFYLGLSRVLNTQPANTSKHAFGPDLNVLENKAARDLLEFVAPIEMLTNSVRLRSAQRRCFGNESC